MQPRKPRVLITGVDRHSLNNLLLYPLCSELESQGVWYKIWPEEGKLNTDVFNAVIISACQTDSEQRLTGCVFDAWLHESLRDYPEWFVDMVHSRMMPGAKMFHV